MASPRTIGVGLGLNARGGRGVKPGYLLKARNSRYLPGDTEYRLWALLGRSRFNSAAIGSTIKSIFPYYVDGGTSKIVAHAGDSLYEANLAETGTFALAKALGGTSSRGGFFAYLQKAYYPSGPSADAGFWTRDPSGWVKGGHRTPTATFTATDQGSGAFASTTDIVYTFRIYDNTTGTESAHGPVVTKAPFSVIAAVRLTWAAGVTLNGERGTHLRIYGSLLSEPAGKLYRLDGTGDGIPLASVVPGYFFDDSVSNVNRLLQGNVQADGEEATLTWAEYGGPPPRARAGTVFNDHGVLWGVPGRESQVLYTAQGLMECYPVDFDGVYQYYLTFSTAKQDTVMFCRPAGPYLLVFNQNTIFRVLNFPTYQDAGFSRKVQDTLTVDHGACGPWAGDSFGIGTEESSYCIYVSREHGPMLTNGVSDRPIVNQANWKALANKAALNQVVVRNYAHMEETWIFYPGPGSGVNNKALIVDYGSSAERGLRVTGPVDVRGDDAFLGWCADRERFYLASGSEQYVYVQDNGATDAQANTNAAGDIALEWGLPAVRLAGHLFKTAEASRLGVEGSSGTAKTFDVSIVASDGVEDYTETDTVQLGPGETDDAANASLTGNTHRAELSYTGPTGTTYDPDDVNAAPCLAGIAWELGAIGRQKRTSGT